MAIFADNFKPVRIYDRYWAYPVSAFLLELALNYSMIPAVRESRFCQKAVFVIPAGMLILFFSVIYRMLVVRWENFQGGYGMY